MTAQHPASTVPQQAPASVHEHGWITESRHSTSEGTVVYVRCAACGARRVDLLAHPTAPPAVLSRVTGAALSRLSAAAARR